MNDISAQEFQGQTQKWQEEPTENLLNLFNSNPPNSRFNGFNFGQVKNEFTDATVIRLHMGKTESGFNLILEVCKAEPGSSVYYTSNKPIAPSPFTMNEPVSSFPKRIPFIARQALVKNWEVYEGTAETAFYAPNSSRVRYYTVNQVTVEDMAAAFSTTGLNHLEILFGINLNYGVVEQPFFTLILKLSGPGIASNYFRYYDYVGACPPNCE